MLKNFGGKLDCIFFCHGVMNYMGGIEGNLIEWDKVNRVNVRSTMQILSICMPFLRMTGGSTTVLSASAGEKPWPGHTIFNCNMASLNMMVRVAALENAHLPANGTQKVRVNAVAPGYIQKKSYHVDDQQDPRSNPEFQNCISGEDLKKVMEEAQIMTPLVRIEEDKNRQQHTKYELISTKDVVTQMLFLGS